MGHLHFEKNDVYQALAERLQQNPVGAPWSSTLLKILRYLYSRTQAQLGSEFPGMFATKEDIEKCSQLSKDEVERALQDMLEKGLVADAEFRGRRYYMLSPMVVGFFEYTFMRSPTDLPLHELAPLFESYLQEPGVAEEIFGGETKMFQAWAYENHMPPEVETEVLDYEKASYMIRESGGGALSMCSCRHKAWHLGKSCDAPLEEVCTSLGKAAQWLIERGFARPAGVEELLRVLEATEEQGLVHLGDNVKKNPAYLCHCCGCCCGVLRAIKERGVSSVHPSNFLPRVEKENCRGCGKCAQNCPVEAVQVMEEIPGDRNSKKAVIREDICLGCGACMNECRDSALSLERRQQIQVPPKNKMEQMVRIAKEKGKIFNK